MGRINAKHLSAVLELVNFDNDYDFETFTNALMAQNLGLKEESLQDIIDYLVYDLDMNCDAELFGISPFETKELVSSINRVLEDQ